MARLLGGESGIIIAKSTKYDCPAGCGKTFFRDDFDGCHVQKVFDRTQKLYIIPLCSGCNHRTDNFYVDENLLVPAP